MFSNPVKKRQILLTIGLLIPAMAWLLVIYIGSLGNLLQNSFFYYDELQEKIVQSYGFISFAKLFTMANLWVILRTLTMAAVVTVAAAVVAFPCPGIWRRLPAAGLNFWSFLP